MKQALDYARNHGLKVFPTRADKSPATSHGFKDATDSPGEHLFQEGNGLGVWPGPSGYVVVDIDVKDGADGDEEWHDLVTAHGLVIETPSVLTPSGGIHLWFKKPTGRTFDNTKLSPGIDIRSDAGYVILPPTEGYEWELSYPDVCKVCSVQHSMLDRAQEFPAELIQVLEKSKLWSPEVQAEGPIPAGSRYDTLFRAGSKMKFAGLTDDLLRKALHEMNATRCRPPHRESHVDKIVQSIIDNPPVNPETGATGIEPTYQRVRHREASGFEPVEWDEVWNKPFPDIDWIPEMEGIAITGRATNIYGPAGVGKSELILHRSVAAAKEGTRVLWLDREMTELDTIVRLKEMGYTSSDLRNFIYVVYPPLHMLDTPEGGEELEGIAEQQDADVIVIDSLSKFVADEEGATHGYFYVNTILPLREADRAVVVIDHAGKDLSRGARGASQKKDNMDLFMECARYAGVGTKLSTIKRRHSWVKDSYVYRRFTDPVLAYHLSNVCVFCKADATATGGPAGKPVCDEHAGV